MLAIPTLLLLAICIIVICNTNASLTSKDDVEAARFSQFLEEEMKKDKLLSLQEELEMLNNPNEYLLNQIKKEYKGKDWDKDTIKITNNDGKREVSIIYY